MTSVRLKGTSFLKNRIIIESAIELDGQINGRDVFLADV